jgi:SNF2 family DNA or RNA helicase
MLLSGSFLRTHLKKEIVPTIFNAMGITQKPVNELVLEQPSKESLIVSKVNDDCSICLDKPSHHTMTKCCNNIFCGECLLRNMQNSNKCPTCRSPIGIDSLKWVAIDKVTDISNNIKSRIDTCIQTLKDNSNNQIIIYTLYDNVYYQLLNKFSEIGIKAEKLDSNPYNVQRISNKFSSGELRVICVSNPEFIRGLSFTNATHVIFYHELPFYEMRELLIRSAQRLGRQNPLEVVYLQPDLDV